MFILEYSLRFKRACGTPACAHFSSPAAVRASFFAGAARTGLELIDRSRRCVSPPEIPTYLAGEFGRRLAFGHRCYVRGARKLEAFGRGLRLSGRREQFSLVNDNRW